MAVRRGRKWLTLYRLRGGGKERVQGWSAPYFQPANQDEHFARLLEEFQGEA